MLIKIPRKIPRIVLLAAAFTLCMSAGGAIVLGADEGTSKKELKRIEREMREKKKEITRVKKKERSILSELDKMDRDIQSGSAELIEQQKRLREAEAGLRDVEKNNAEINAKLAELKRTYGQRVRALYKMSRSGNSGLLSADSLSSALKRVRYLSMVAERDHALIKEYGIELDRLAVRQAAIADMKQDVLSRRQTTEAKRIELEKRKGKKADILAGVRKEKKLYEQTLRELEESSASLWAMIKRSEQEKKESRTTSPGTASKGALVAGKNRLPWPVNGQVLTRFGMQRHPQFGSMVFRRGIEIAAKKGDPVRAVSEGSVAYANWYKGYGKLIILEHGNGLYTLYGNLSQLEANEGERVAREQVIGRAGDTGSTKGAKLYFEIRRNGEAQDPLAWLAKK